MISRNHEVAALWATGKRQPLPQKADDFKPGLSDSSQKTRKNTQEHMIKITPRNGELYLKIASRESKIWRHRNY